MSQDRVYKTDRYKHSPLQRFLLALVRCYQLLISPLLGPRCRFHPTCSHYATESINRHGVVKGLALTSRRLVKCHPFHPGGVDLVPLGSDQANDSAHTNDR